LKEKDLIARFMSIGLSVVLISDSEENIFLLSETIRSNILSIIRLKTYTTEQSFDILKDRAEKASMKDHPAKQLTMQDSKVQQTNHQPSHTYRGFPVILDFKIPTHALSESF
jgi:Cdc6-like AAA superfamily ATPase